MSLNLPDPQKRSSKSDWNRKAIMWLLIHVTVLWGGGHPCGDLTTFPSKAGWIYQNYVTSAVGVSSNQLLQPFSMNLTWLRPLINCWLCSSAVKVHLMVICQWNDSKHVACLKRSPPCALGIHYKRTNFQRGLDCAKPASVSSTELAVKD